MARYSVTDHGVTPDCGQPQTAALQALIDRCEKEGGGHIVFPPGRYISGTLKLCSDLTLELEKGAFLCNALDEEEFPLFAPSPIPFYEGRDGIRALLFALGRKNITLRGEGVIDGRNGEFPDRAPHRSMPRLIWFGRCENVTVSGLILQDSVFWVQHYLQCRRVRISGLQVRSHACENNDGMDIDSCTDVEISDCRVDTGDDGICLKTGTCVPCSDVYVHDCVLSSHCSAFKLGTESNGGFTRIRAERLTVIPSESTHIIPGEDYRACAAIGIGAVDGAFVDGVRITDMRIYGARMPFYFRWGNRKRGVSGEPGGGGEPSYFRNVFLENVQAFNAAPRGCYICGMEGHEMENIVLRNCSFEFNGPTAPDWKEIEIPEEGRPFPNTGTFGPGPFPALIFVRHVKGFRWENCSVRKPFGDLRPDTTM